MERQSVNQPATEQQDENRRLIDDRKVQDLYKKMVKPKIKRCTSTGITVLPVSALQEFCTKAGFKDEDLSYFTLTLPGAKEGEMNYFLGPDSAEDATVLVMGIYYYFEEEDVEEELAPNKTLEQSAYRRFYDGNVAFSGFLQIDQHGMLWLEGSIADNIFVDYAIGLSPNSKGYEFVSENNAMRVRVWFDGESFYSERVNLFDTREPS